MMYLVKPEIYYIAENLGIYTNLNYYEVISVMEDLTSAY